MSETQAPTRRRPDVARLFQQSASPMPSALQDETRRVAERVFLQSAQQPGLAGPVTPGDLLGPYRIERLLGLGGQAYVYAGRHVQLGRRVALKVPRPEVAERLLDEGRLAARLQHPHVARVEDVAESDGTPFLVMEHCEGGSLDQRLELYPEGLPLPEVQRIGVALLEALAYAHGQGIVHRDVKPANVLFDGHDQVKLGDLGTGSVAMQGAPLAHSVELSGPLGVEIAGTPLYMSPEQENPQLLAGGALDGRSDLFSYGKLIFTLLTGSSPRTVRPPSRLRRGLDPAWDEFVFKLLEEDREERYASAEAALHALRGLSLVDGAPAPAAPLPEPVLVEAPPAAPADPAHVERRTRTAQRVFGGAALALLAFLALLEVRHPTIDPASAGLLPLKGGALLAGLFLAWFRKRERFARPSTSLPAAICLSGLIGGWPLAVYALADTSVWWAHQLSWVTGVLSALTCALGVIAGFKLWRVRKIRAVARPTPPQPPARRPAPPQAPPQRTVLGGLARITAAMFGMVLIAIVLIVALVLGIVALAILG